MKSRIKSAVLVALIGLIASATLHAASVSDWAGACSLCATASSSPDRTNDKTGYEQLVHERIHEGLERMADHPSPFKGASWALRHAFVRRLTGREQDSALLNKAILDYCTTYTLDRQAVPTAYHDPRPEHTLFSLYLKPECLQLLTPESRDAIEDACWRWVYRHSFLTDPFDGKGRPWPLNNPTKDVWLISGSENHDAIQRAAILLSLQILMKAGAPYGPDAKLYDGHTVAEHYKQWIRWYPEFFRQRIREGLTCEIAHPSSYGAGTIGAFYSIEDLTDSADVQQAARDFLAIFWANVACEFEPRTGIRASITSTRCYKFTWNQTGTIYWARDILYAYGWTDVKTDSSLGHVLLFTSGYRPPAILRAIASDLNRPAYMGVSRRFGRGSGWHYGIYQVLFDDGEARNSYLRRDTWYTQAYTMSALSLDPGRDYIQLIDQSRVMGVTFSHDIDDRLVVYAGNTPATKKVEYKMATSNGVNGMLGPDCLIVARDPNADPKTANSTRVFISDGSLWDNREENDGGWFLTRAGDGYAAFRIVGGYTVVPSPYGNGYFLEFNDIWTPVVIQMGQAKDYQGDFEAFKSAVKARPVTYADGKLTYTALNGDTYEYRANSKTLPTINGQPLNLNPPMTYDFPYLKMQHGSSKAVICYPGHKDLTLDFEAK